MFKKCLIIFLLGNFGLHCSDLVFTEGKTVIEKKSFHRLRKNDPDIYKLIKKLQQYNEGIIKNFDNTEPDASFTYKKVVFEYKCIIIDMRLKFGDCYRALLGKNSEVRRLCLEYFDAFLTDLEGSYNQGWPQCQDEAKAEEIRLYLRENIDDMTRCADQIRREEYPVRVS